MGSNNGAGSCSSPDTASAPTMDRSDFGQNSLLMNILNFRSKFFLFYELNIIEAKCLTLVRYCGGALNCDGANPAKTQSHTIVRSRKLLKEFIINKLFTYFQ